MVLGVFQRHYKIYNGASFIPFHSGEPESLSTFIGNNGHGKSSILECLDTFFNNRPFNINSTGKKSQAFVAPLFLINENQFKSFTPDSRKIIESVSNFLWNEGFSKTANYRPYEEFFKYRDKKLSSYMSNYYLFTISKQFDHDDRFFLTFTNQISKKVLDDWTLNISRKNYNQLISEINAKFSYIYIPVETSIEDFLRLETSGMQNLIDRKVSDAIDETLKKKQIKDNSSGRVKTISLLDILNDNLQNYIDEIENKIKSIDNSYNFKMDSRVKQKLTPNDLKDQIIYSYISKRSLRKDEKPIKNLSAGERKKALVDVAYSLISGNTNREKYILLAIDEPESSLHISNCFNQFERIEEISKSDECQVLLTTHWYGALPILNKGSLVHLKIGEKLQPTFTLFNFRNYFEDRGYHPDDIQLKSFYDLTTSIISSIRHNDTNWLIVEGTDDLNYIKRNLTNENIKILPVGGCAVVKLLYDFLFVPLSHKTENKEVSGKIFCLIDTDNEKSYELQHECQTKSGNLMLRRLQLKNDKIALVKDDDYNRFPTEIENSVYSKDFYRALETSTKQLGRQDLLKDFKVEDVEHSNIIGDDSMMIYLGNGSNLKKAKNDLLKFIDGNKERISKNYFSLNAVKKLNWMIEINTFFT